MRASREENADKLRFQKEIRDHFSITPGSAIRFRVEGGEIVIRQIAAPLQLAKWQGLLRRTDGGAWNSRCRGMRVSGAGQVIFAIDTNMRSNILIPNPEWFQQSLASVRISREAPFAASGAWRKYRKAGGRRWRMLPGFLVGAHAMAQATCLVSRDGGFYRE